MLFNSSVCEKFKISDLFDVLNGKGITKEEIENNPGSFPAIQSGEDNNGILGMIDYQYCVDMEYTMTDSPCLAVARSGSAGFVSYHEHGCVVGDSAKLLLIKDTSKVTLFTYLFLRTIMMANQYKYAYGRKVTEDKLRNELILLPAIINEGEKSVPDWTFMDMYMRTLLYNGII